MRCPRADSCYGFADNTGYPAIVLVSLHLSRGFGAACNEAGT